MFDDTFQHGRSSMKTVDCRNTINRTFDRNELETGFDVPLGGYEDPQSNKCPFMTFRVDYIGQRSI